jgi:hypothetical protein
VVGVGGCNVKYIEVCQGWGGVQCVIYCGVPGLGWGAV